MGAAGKLYNGNIAETFWSTATDGGFVRNYGYKYDQLNRLKDATYQKSGQLTNMYNENLNYDKNGNIMNLSRYGDRDEQYLPIQIDNLGYTYATNSNKLMSVVDNSNNTSGFKDGITTGDDYAYDANGNMTVDKNKNITGIVYNHLNLPTKIIFPTGNIVYFYNASGQKAQKVVTENTTVTTTDYLGGYQYKNAVLQFFPTAEGYVKNTPVSGTNTYSYVFNYTDHLGNVRLSYTKDATTGSLKILEENNYYPFGLKHSPYNAIAPAPEYKYKFNGKELQDELGLDMYDFGARLYDRQLNIWRTPDPKAETSRRFSPYAYALNNPIYFIDPDGMQADDWIEYKGKNGQQQIIYDSSVKTKAQAEAKYSNVKQVFEAGTGKSAKTGEVVSFQKDGTFSVNGGKSMDVDDTSYTTKGGTYIGENKGVVDAFGDFGPEGLQKGGDAMMKSAGVAALSGAEPLAAGLATVGSTMSSLGAGGKILNDAVEGKFDLQNAVIQAFNEAASMFINKFTRDDNLSNIMLQNGINEIAKGFEKKEK